MHLHPWHNLWNISQLLWNKDSNFTQWLYDHDLKLKFIWMCNTGFCPHTFLACWVSSFSLLDIRYIDQLSLWYKGSVGSRWIAYFYLKILKYPFKKNLTDFLAVTPWFTVFWCYEEILCLIWADDSIIIITESPLMSKLCLLKVTIEIDFIIKEHLLNYFDLSSPLIEKWRTLVFILTYHTFV